MNGPRRTQIMRAFLQSKVEVLSDLNPWRYIGVRSGGTFVQVKEPFRDTNGNMRRGIAGKGRHSAASRRAR